jgi:hypothetical protein
MNDLAFVPTEKLESDITEVDSELQRLADFAKGLDPQGFIANNLSNLIQETGKQVLLAKREKALRAGALGHLYAQEAAPAPLEKAAE